MNAIDAAPRQDGDFTDMAAAAAWVAGFAEGWRAPSGPDAFTRHFRELLAADVRLIQPQLPTLVGHHAFEQQFVRPLFALMPDLRCEVEHWAASGNTLYIEVTLNGTLGRRDLSWRACDRVTLRDGVAIERQSYFDPAPLMRAVITTPRAWPAFLRLQTGQIVSRLQARRHR